MERPNILFILFGYHMHHGVMRCAMEADINIFVLGSGGAKYFRTSLRCGGYASFDAGQAKGSTDYMYLQLAAAVERFNIDLIVPTDTESTEMIAKLSRWLPVPCFPISSWNVIAELGNKWDFKRLCQENGIRHPDTQLYPNRKALEEAVLEGRIPLPVTVKPLDRSGGAGVIHIRHQMEWGKLRGVDYEPVLVQQHIEGRDADISVLAEDGKILRSAIQFHEKASLRFGWNEELWHFAETIVAARKFSGILHIDARLEARTNRIYVIESNPRFWFSVYAAMLAGMNFMTAGIELGLGRRLPPRILRPARIKTIAALWQMFIKPWRIRPRDFRDFFRIILRDPLPSLLVLLPSAREAVLPPLPRIAFFDLDALRSRRGKAGETP